MILIPSSYLFAIVAGDLELVSDTLHAIRESRGSAHLG